MIKLLLSKLLPLGLTGAFLQSSVSPLKPALAAFEAANGVLAGGSQATTDANFDAMLDAQLKKGGGSTGAPAAPANAKDQLNAIIAQVKGQSDAPAPSSAPKPTHQAHSSGKAVAATTPPKGPETKLTSVGR